MPYKEAMNHLYTICIGSNTLPEITFNEAAAAVRATLTDEHHSSTYASPDALGRVGVAPYLNQVVRGICGMPLEQASVLYKNIEHKYGRSTSDGIPTRVPLDIDIVCIDSTILRPIDYVSPYFVRGLKEIN